MLASLRLGVRWLLIYSDSDCATSSTIVFHVDTNSSTVVQVVVPQWETTGARPVGCQAPDKTTRLAPDRNRDLFQRPGA